MSRVLNTSWLHRFAVATALATFVLLGIGGLVTSHGAGMAVPDWPTSYGYNLFLLPIKFWKGGILYEHTHRLWASVVGVLAVALTRWLGGERSRLPLAMVGAIEVAAGLALLKWNPKLSGAGHFLSGIGAVVLVAAATWVRNKPAARPLPLLGWLAFGGVQLQGLLGGLRVVLFNDGIGIFHAALAQLFFVLLCAIALLTSKWWRTLTPALSRRTGEGDQAATLQGDNPSFSPLSSFSSPVLVGSGPGARTGTTLPRRLLIGVTVLILLQLVLGAAMRHEHAGLAIPDFPLAYGRFWPATDAQSVARYNQQRLEVAAANAITGFQIQLQMAHRLLAILILAGVGLCAWRVRALPSRQRPDGAATSTTRTVLPPKGGAATSTTRTVLPPKGGAPSKAIRTALPPGSGTTKSELPGGGTTNLEPPGGVSIHGVVGRLAWLWLGLILAQVALGAFTVLSNKAADVATAHVLVGAVSLATGAILCILSFRNPDLIADVASAEPTFLRRAGAGAGNCPQAAGNILGAATAR
jgi:cytochrome c oxidase assembly protein subunit 15